MKPCKVIFTTILVTASLFFTPSLLAQEYENVGNINFGVAAWFADSVRGIDDDTGFFLGGELPLAERWSLAADYYTIDSEVKFTGGDADLDFIRFGFNYHLNQLNGWQPFVGFGIGNVDVDRSGLLPDNDEDTFDVGFGMKRMINDKWMLRGDYKVIKGFDNHGWDDAVTIGVAYAFGRRSAPVAARPTTQAPTPARQTPTPPTEMDSDRDGVVDSRDNCPNTSANLAVDNNGCPILDVSQRRQELLVNFDYDQSVVKPEFDDEIADFADFMEEYGNTNAVIEGHTDNRGSDAYNQALSERRANAVRDELVNEHGIANSRLSTVGYGESRPVSTANTEAGHAQNRRIEAVISVEVEEQRRR